MENRFSVIVERDPADDADDHGGYRVVEKHRGCVPAVLFRGDTAECQDYAQSYVHDCRTLDAMSDY